MRILLVGRGSFIARAVADAARHRGVDVLALPHTISPKPSPGDCIINFAIDPNYRTQPYDAEQDYDLRTARAAHQAGAHMVMLSTRRVYSPETRWNAVVGGNDTGDSPYGRNKAISEKAVLDVSAGQAGIFRLSNIFGYEYDSNGARRSFLGILLASLKHKNTIFFDMSPDTRRDFLPVEICADLLLDRALDRSTGIHNLGAGFPLACGQLAQWICEGYGCGDLIYDPNEIQDEFFLNMDQWRQAFALPINENILQEYCKGLGRRLKCEKS